MGVEPLSSEAPVFGNILDKALLMELAQNPLLLLVLVIVAGINIQQSIPNITATIIFFLRTSSARGLLFGFSIIGIV